MKELSTEQKAKAYDEALSVARKTHQTQPMYRDWLEKMFPELAESEDERVIKFIKNQLFNIKKKITDNYKLDTELTKAIDWLEKQGEKPQRIVSAEAKEAMYDKPAPLRTGAIGFDGEPMESKPCEQKPDEWEPQTGDTFRKKGTTFPTYHLCNKREDGITFGFVENREVGGIAGGEITIFALKDDYELVKRPKSIEDVVEEELNRVLQTKVEQNPWSEKDETNLNDAIDACKAQYGNMSYTADWLLSIKDRVQPQPKQEWNEEDEYCRHQLIVFCENCMVPDSGAKRCAHWLKSLRPQSHWKPSDEQMKILNEVLYFAANHESPHWNDYIFGTLNNFIRQLKKLMEE